MTRFTTTTLLALALVLPLSASAGEPTVDQKAPEAMVVAVAEDAVIMPAAPPAREEKSVAEKRTPRRAPHGSSQSAGEFRFTNPYGFPQQTLPVQFPALATFGF
jgi:hypothetical protein